MGWEVVYYNHKEQTNRPKAGKEIKKMNADFSIYLTQWGCFADEMRWVCESNKNGMICATFRTYQQAVEWCENKGYSHN